MEKLPSTHTYLLLGDAYINIQEVSGRWNSYVSYDFPFLVSKRNTVPVPLCSWE